MYPVEAFMENFENTQYFSVDSVVHIFPLFFIKLLTVSIQGVKLHKSVVTRSEIYKVLGLKQ